MKTERQSLYVVELNGDAAMFRVDLNSAKGRRLTQELQEFLCDRGIDAIAEDRPANRQRDSTAKLSFTEVRKLRRRRRENPDLTYEDLAEEFGISSTQVGRILRREHWDDVDDR